MVVNDVIVEFVVIPFVSGINSTYMEGYENVDGSCVVIPFVSGINSTEYNDGSK